MPTPIAVTNAVSALRNAENGALARSAANEESLYTGSGREQPQSRTKVKGKKKGMFVIALILSIMIGGGAWLGSSNTMLGPMMSANLTSTVDWGNGSYVTRVMKTTTAILNSTAKSVTVPTTEIPTKFRNNLAIYDVEAGTKSFTWKGTTLDGSNFESTVYGDIELYTDFMNGKQGRAANFYDPGANKTLQNNGVSRNTFVNFRQTDDAKVDMDNFEDTMRSKFDNSSTSLRSYAEGEEEYTTKNEKGEDVTETKLDKYDDSEQAKANSSNDIEVAESNTRAMLNKVAQRVGQIGSIGCAVMQMGTMISAPVAANEIYASVKYYMLIMENISKMMSGAGDTSAYHSTMNLLSSNAVSEISDFNSIQGAITSDASQPTMSTITDNKSPLEDPGLQMGLSGASGNAATGKNYSIERVALALGGTLAMGRNATLACQGVQAVNSIISIGVTLASAGTAGIVATVVNQFLSVNTLKSIALGVVFGFLVPTLAKSFFTNLFDTTKGISIGALIMKGAVASVANQIGKQNSGLTISSAEKVVAFNKHNNIILALEAASDRLTRSPFDITNRNTFLGSIAYSMLPSITSSGVKTFTSLAGAAGQSIASLTGRVVAEGEDSSYVTTFGDCPLLESIGAVGDIYCNPITVSDMDTVNLDPEDATYVKVISDNTDCTSESCTIKDDSNLAKYITFCDGRLSPYGITDQNILNAASKGNIVLNSIPLVGDIVSLIDNTAAAANVDWATGQKCGNTEENKEFWEAEGRYFQRYIEDQRIYEQIGAYDNDNQSGYNTDGKSPVTAYKEKYEAENPVDNSYAGYIARISGMTKENAEDMLAFVDYYRYIDDYDAAIRIAFDGAASATKSSEDIVAEILEEQSPKITNSDIVDDDSPLVLPKTQYIVYDDIRNRNYAI